MFVSYRRTEARNAAVQLHDELTARGFDVFLDTHDIRPGEPFQEVLFHRLVDCDVMVMLDTPTYFESRWTKEEIGRARAKEIQVLRVIWPEHKPNRMTDLAETVYVDPDEMKGADGPFTDSLVDTIANHLEALRSRSIASRERTIVGKLKAEIGMIGGSIDGVGAYRAVGLKLEDGRRLWAYPVVGIPSAESLHDVVRKAESAAIGEVPILVYDHVGIREVWLSHLEWLGEQIHAVRQIKISEAGWALAGWH
ncbi:MAG: toll/interleukin-1 receptor domain-containing protein [Sphingomicrobium sp.]